MNDVSWFFLSMKRRMCFFFNNGRYTVDAELELIKLVCCGSKKQEIHCLSKKIMKFTTDLYISSTIPGNYLLNGRLDFQGTGFGFQQLWVSKPHLTPYPARNFHRPYDQGLFTILKGSNHLLRMVMEPKYYAEKVMGHSNHQLRIWLDA